MKILIAEDTEDSRVMLELALKNKGYEVMSAQDGLEALHMAQVNPLDLIISDILMPEMDGFELCRQVKADLKLKKIPFIFYTATYTERQDEELAMALGASRFLIKPLVPDDLLKIIDEVLMESRDEELQAQQEPKREEPDLDEMHLQSVTRKLNKKVTELEQERAALQESEEKFRTIFESSNDALMLLNDGGFFDCNKATLKIFGCETRKKFLGSHPADWSPATQPDGRNSREAVEEKIATAYRQGRSFFEWQYIRANEDEFPAEVLLTPFKLEGKTVLQATVRDISEKKRHTQELDDYRNHLEEQVMVYVPKHCARQSSNTAQWRISLTTGRPGLITTGICSIVLRPANALPVIA